VVLGSQRYLLLREEEVKWSCTANHITNGRVAFLKYFDSHNLCLYVKSAGLAFWGIRLQRTGREWGTLNQVWLFMRRKMEKDSNQTYIILFNASFQHSDLWYVCGSSFGGILISLAVCLGEQLRNFSLFRIALSGH
jgi:hypothetical protein